MEELNIIITVRWILFVFAYIIPMILGLLLATEETTIKDKFEMLIMSFIPIINIQTYFVFNFKKIKVHKILNISGFGSFKPDLTKNNVEECCHGTRKIH